MVEERTDTVEAAGGVRIFYRYREAERARASVLMVHGLGEHSGRYDALGDALTRADIDVCAVDLRGHGRSQGRRGHARAFDLFLRDLDRVRRRARVGRPAVPAFLIGHSLGGLVVGRYVQEFGFPALAGAVLVAPFVAVATEPPAWKTRLAAAADALVPALTLDHGLRTSDMLRDPAERDAYEGDPLVHRRLSVRLWSEMMREADRLCRQAEQTRTALLFQLAGTDRIVSTAASRRLVGRLSGPVAVREYPEAYHALYHDPASTVAIADLIDWLDERLAGGAGAEGAALV